MPPRAVDREGTDEAYWDLLNTLKQAVVEIYGQMGESIVDFGTL